MTFVLPELPYSMDALVPHISRETLEFHYGKHHQTYVTNLNNLTKEGPWAGKSLEEIIAKADGGVFNNAAQIWNHTFYWHSLSPNSGGKAFGAIESKINEAFGSFDAFKEQFSKAATTYFGSGWAWLVTDKNHDKVWIESTGNAGCPLREGHIPLLTCDVWEHAYYIDYRNARAKYVEAWWNLVNWDFANQNFSR